MLLLLFQVGTWRYALDARQVVSVVSPRLMREQPDAPDRQTPNQQAIVGYFQRIGDATIVSVIDLSQLLMGHPSPRHFGTRVMLVKDQCDRLWGLMATSMVETLTIDETLWNEAKTLQNASSGHPYVQQVLMQEQTLLHGLAIDHIFTQVNPPK